MSLIICAAAALPAFAVTTGGATVEASALNLRADAGTQSAVKLVIPSKAFVLVEGEEDGWYKVLYNGQEGYVSTEYASYAAEMDGSFTGKGTVTGVSVRLREGPSLDAKVLGYANTGDSFDITGVSGEWLKVKGASGATYYINSSYVSVSGDAAAVTDTGIVATAKEYLGSRYVWGGMSPSGFDCSGFVNYIYDLYGYDLHRVAQDIYSYDGSFVAKDSLQAGDVVCFGYGSKSITHVGLYIGDGQFIHASTYSTGVIISSLDESYYVRMYVGAKRIMG